MNDAPQLFHLGKKVKRIREIRGVKQETLANDLGVTHQAISKMEQSETIDDETLEKVAAALGVSADAIKNYSDEAMVNIIATTVNNHDQSASVFYNPTFNPIDKLLETLEENKKLYERLLQSEREKNELLSASIKKQTD